MAVRRGAERRRRLHGLLLLRRRPVRPGARPAAAGDGHARRVPQGVPAAGRQRHGGNALSAGVRRGGSLLDSNGGLRDAQPAGLRDGRLAGDPERKAAASAAGEGAGDPHPTPDRGAAAVGAGIPGPLPGDGGADRGLLFGPGLAGRAGDPGSGSALRGQRPGDHAAGGR